MSLTLTVGGTWDRGLRQVSGGTDITSQIDYRSLTVTDTMRDGANTMSFDLLLPAVNIAGCQVGNLAQLLQDGQLMFAGSIKTTTSSVLQTNSVSSNEAPVLRLSVHCADWTGWLDRRPVNGTYPATLPFGVFGASAGSILRSIIDDPNKDGALICSKSIIGSVNGNSGVPYDFGYNTVGGSITIDDGLMVPQQVVLFKPFTTVIGELARETGYVWYVGSDRIIHFFNRISGFPANQLPNINGQPTLDLDGDITSYGDCVTTEDISQVITRVLLIDGQLKQQVPVQLPNTLTGTGQYFFALPDKPIENYADFSASVTYPGNNTGIPDRIYDAAHNNLGIEYKTGSPRDPQPWPDICYICNTNQGMRIGGAAIPALSTVTANYKFAMATGVDRYGEFPPGTSAILASGEVGYIPGATPILFGVSSFNDEHPGEMDFFDGNDGSDDIYTRIVSDPTLTMDTIDVGKKLADTWLRRFGGVQRMARFTSFIQGWRSGQYFTLSSVARNFNPNSGTNSEKMWVYQVTMRPFYNHTINQWQLQSNVEASNNPWGN